MIERTAVESQAAHLGWLVYRDVNREPTSLLVVIRKRKDASESLLVIVETFKGRLVVFERVETFHLES